MHYINVFVLYAVIHANELHAVMHVVKVLHAQVHVVHSLHTAVNFLFVLLSTEVLM